MISRLASCLFSVSVTILLSTASRADDVPNWPQWRGPDRSGVSRDKGLLKKWPEGGPRQVWKKTDIGKGFSSVSLGDGRLYTIGTRGDYEYVIALSLTNGEELWAKSIGKAYKNSYGDGPRSTPTVDQDRLYALGANGDLACMYVKSGDTSWTMNILKEFGASNIKWGISESPLIDDVRVVVMPGAKDATLVALNKIDGSVVWKSKGLSDAASYASGILANVGGVKQAIYLTDAAAVGVKSDDGTLLWRNTRPANNVANCTTPIYRDGLAFICSAYDTGGVLLRLTSKGGKTHADEVYFTRDMMNHHGGAVLVGDYLYGFSNNTLTCLEFHTGKVRWKDHSVGKGSITAADGMLYCLSETGIMGLVHASPDRYQEASRFSFKVKGGHSWAHPVVTGGRLYIRNGDEVTCYDVRAN